MMRHSFKLGFGIFNTLLAMLFSSVLLASTEGDAPRAVIEGATAELLKAIESAQGTYAKDPAIFESDIDRIMLPIIDFRSFARGVMGKHGGKKAYEALETDDEKAAFDARVDRFTDKFKSGLIATYSKGLITFSGGNIDVMPSVLSKRSGSALVVQLVRSDEGAKPIKIRYKLRADDEGNWLVRNVYIQTVNLGRVYRSQFREALKLHGGDVEQVIEQWVVGSTDLDKT